MAEVHCGQFFSIWKSTLIVVFIFFKEEIKPTTPLDPFFEFQILDIFLCIWNASFFSNIMITLQSSCSWCSPSPPPPPPPRGRSFSPSRPSCATSTSPPPSHSPPSSPHKWLEHGLREKKCFTVDLFWNWQMMMCRFRIQKLKIGRLADFEKIDFENFTL